MSSKTVKDFTKIASTEKAVKHGSDKFAGRDTKFSYEALSLKGSVQEGEEDTFENDPQVLPPIDDEDDEVFAEEGIIIQDKQDFKKSKTASFDCLSY